ncbi:uncharacterized protein LOC134236019 isoform X2 [Saccostrea cucullata]|uniref:uncharacterized protein LOC134236019 isoform X2 n=1 Tax=Saccostrea cuccullata TaxID=36930 RepID=UPI002ED0958B
MAAPSVYLCCRLCHGILPKKQRRTIFGETFGVFDQLLEILDYVPRPNDERGNYVCGMCWNKLNKLAKVEHDIKTKVESLKAERYDIIKNLRQKYQGDISVEQPKIWTPKSKKHNIVHSPTPRKVKQVFVTSQLESSQSAKKERAKTQLFSPSKIKVVYRGTKEKVKSKLIPSGDYQKIIKCMSKGESHKKVSEVIYNSSLKEKVLNCVVKDVRKELSKLSSTKTASFLRKTSSDELATMNFETLNLELQLHSQVLYKIISGFYNDSNPMAVAVIAAIVQKQRNMHMSAFHHAVSQVLDNGGATDECINLLNKLGLCVSSSAAAKKKSDFIARQTDHIENLVISEKIALEQNTDSLPAILQNLIHH